MLTLVVKSVRSMSSALVFLGFGTAQQRHRHAQVVAQSAETGVGLEIGRGLCVKQQLIPKLNRFQGLTAVAT